MPYGPEGSLDAKIACIAEAPARQEMILGRPLVGPSGQLWDQLCLQAKLSRRLFYISNVLDEPIINIKMYISAAGNLTARGIDAIGRLDGELEGCGANVIVCMGNLSLKALAGRHGILKWRGSILEATLTSIEGKKVIPTIHPAATFKGQYLWRYNILRDLQRVKREAEFPEIRRPPYRFVLDPSLAECLDWLDRAGRASSVSVDTENSGSSISRISFALSHYDVISIPFSNSRWTREEEAQLWLAIQQVMGDPNIAKVGQNFTHDITMLIMQNSIITRGEVHDTMVAHHIMYPDFPKGLGYLTSLYTDQPYHKGMVRHGEIAKADG